MNTYFFQCSIKVKSYKYPFLVSKNAVILRKIKRCKTMKILHFLKRILPLVVVALFISNSAWANDFAVTMSSPVVSTSIGVGTIIAIMASWTRNKSVLWAIFHAILGWFYVVYYVITR